MTDVKFQFWALFFVLILSSSLSQATEPKYTQDLLVRISPELSVEEVLAEVPGALWSQSASTVHQLHFTDEASLQEAMLALAKDDRVLSFTRNQLYQLALFKGTFSRNQHESLDSTEHLLSRPPPPPEVLLPQPEHSGNDPLLEKDWAWASIRMPSQLPPLKKIISVAVTDTGVDYNHEDLVNAMWRKTGSPTEVGYDFAHKNAKPFDVVQYDLEGCMKDANCKGGYDPGRFLVNPGHGTHCAGHVAAVANNTLGIRGVGDGAQIMALKFFYDVGDANPGQGDTLGSIRAIDYAIQNGARIISASWGSSHKPYLAEKSELYLALVRAQNAGILVVAAAGNDGEDNDAVAEPMFPASYGLDNVLAVAASNKLDELANFSSYGRKSVDIAAPGVRILSTVPGSQYQSVAAKYDGPGEKMTLYWDGTSMATPLVAGAAALLWSRYPGADYKQIKAALLKSARKVPSLESKVSSGGVLDVTAALLEMAKL